MWLSKMNEMSIGPLWVLRTPSGDGAGAEEAGQQCARCKTPWLLSVPEETALLVVLASAVDEQQQQLLQNCLHAAGWRDRAALMSLHHACSTGFEPGLQALKSQLASSPVDTIVVFGTDTALAIDPSFVRGKIHQHQNARLIVTHYPQHMLTTPALKAQVWADLCMLLQDA